MEQSQLEKSAATKDAQVMPRKEDFVAGTVERSKYAAQKDAPIVPEKEEFVVGTGRMTRPTMMQMQAGRFFMTIIM